MSILRKLVPTPLSSAALFVTWLALARSASPSSLLLGLGLALALPVLTAKLRPSRMRVGSPSTIVRFILRVGYDVVLSNFAVFRDVVMWRWRRPRSQFVIIPLELRDPLGLAVLSMVTTIVPGTVWSELALDRSALLLHVWRVGDEADFVAHFKDRYEKPLREIFE